MNIAIGIIILLAGLLITGKAIEDLSWGQVIVASIGLFLANFGWAVLFP